MLKHVMTIAVLAALVVMLRLLLPASLPYWQQLGATVVLLYAFQWGWFSLKRRRIHQKGRSVYDDAKTETDGKR